jgi:hypothetical protein
MDQTQREQPAASPVSGATPGTSSGPGAMDAIIAALVRTGPWVRFLAVLGFVGIGLAVLAGLVIVLAGFTTGDPGLGMGFGLVYLAMAAVYAIPLVPLHRLANEASRLKRAPDPDSAARAVEHGRSFWVAVGVLTIIGIALGPVVLLVSVFVTLASR